MKTGNFLATPSTVFTRNKSADQQGRSIVDIFLHFAWLPIPLFILLIGFLWQAKYKIVFDPPYLLLLLNFTFSTAVSLFIAGLAAISFARNALFPVLIMGCGMLFFSAVSLIAAIAINFRQVNIGLTVYNIGMCLSGACHVLAAAAYISFERIKKNAIPVLIGLYGLVLTITGFLTYMAFEGVIPIFFVQGDGATELRQAVLGTAVGLFGLAGIMVAMISRKHPWPFGRWYALSLGLIATGLFGVLIIKNVGSPLGWAGRTAQYLGGIYMFGAVIAAARQNGEWDAALQLALKEKERLLQTIIKNSRDGIHQFDIVKGKYVFMSSAQEKLTGFSCEELMLNLKEAAKRVHPEDRITVDRYMERLMSGEYVEEPMEYRWRVKSGEYRWFSDIRSVIRDEQGWPVALVGNSRDITKRKQIEDQLQRAHDELELRVQERTAELRKQAKQLARLSSELTMAEQLERKRLAQVLHDHLQQLLVGAKIQLETLVGDIADHQKKDALKIITLLTESLNASRFLTMELAPPTLKKKEIAATMIWLAEWMQNTHGLTVELKIEPDLEIDREHLRILLFQSIRELLFNTIKHAGTNTATVELKSQGSGYLQVIVFDHGKGFDTENMMSEKQENGGFGLFSIRERLKLIGGQFHIDSAIGSGSRFTIAVPQDTE